MFAPAVCAAAFTESLPVRICPRHRAQDVSVLDVNPVPRRRDEPARLGLRELIDRAVGAG